MKRKATATLPPLSTNRSAEHRLGVRLRLQNLAERVLGAPLRQAGRFARERSGLEVSAAGLAIPDADDFAPLFTDTFTRHDFTSARAT